MLTTQPSPRSAIAIETALRSTASTGEMSASYETPKRRISSSGDDETTDDDDVRGFYEIASPYLNNMRFLDEQQGNRRDRIVLKICNSDVIADVKGDMIRGSDSGVQRNYLSY